MNIGDTIQVNVTINNIPMSLPGTIEQDLGSHWLVKVHYSDGITNYPIVRVPK